MGASEERAIVQGPIRGRGASRGETRPPPAATRRGEAPAPETLAPSRAGLSRRRAQGDGAGIRVFDVLNVSARSLETLVDAAYTGSLNITGATALDLAREGRSRKVIQLLEQASRR